MVKWKGKIIRFRCIRANNSQVEKNIFNQQKIGLYFRNFKALLDIQCLVLSVYHLLYTGDTPKYEGWNFNSGNYLFTTDTK